MTIQRIENPPKQTEQLAQHHKTPTDTANGFAVVLTDVGNVGVRHPVTSFNILGEPVACWVGLSALNTPNGLKVGHV